MSCSLFSFCFGIRSSKVDFGINSKGIEFYVDLFLIDLLYTCLGVGGTVTIFIDEIGSCQSLQTSIPIVALIEIQQGIVKRDAKPERFVGAYEIELGAVIPQVYPGNFKFSLVALEDLTLD